MAAGTGGGGCDSFALAWRLWPRRQGKLGGRAMSVVGLRQHGAVSSCGRLCLSASARSSLRVHSSSLDGPSTSGSSMAGNTSSADSMAASASESPAEAANAGAAPRRSGPKQRMRLDEYCMQLQPQFSRNVIASFIVQGKVCKRVPLRCTCMGWQAASSGEGERPGGGKGLYAGGAATPSPFTHAWRKSFSPSFCTQVSVAGKVVTKAGTPVSWIEGGPPPGVVIDCEEPKYVSRAGFKLEKALLHFGIDVRYVCASPPGAQRAGGAPASCFAGPCVLEGLPAVTHARICPCCAAQGRKGVG